MPDWPSFGWGTALGAGAAFATGFLKKAGEAALTALASRFKDPEPVQVNGKFVPNLYVPGACAWVQDAKLYEYEELGYTFYPHPNRQAKCFRLTADGPKVLKEWLMVKPGGAKNG